MDLSREEETKKLLSESLGLVSMNTFQKEFIERIGCRVQPIKLKDLNSNQSKTVRSIKKALLEFRFKKLEQFRPESKTNKNEVVTNEYGSSELCLEDRLIKFDQEVIRKECPNTPEEHRLMRPEMLEKLLEFLPTNIVEFGGKIPPYLRIPMQTMHPTNPDSQSKYIKDVVNIIDEFGER
jgi:restriction endonuclease